MFIQQEWDSRLQGPYCVRELDIHTHIHMLDPFQSDIHTHPHAGSISIYLSFPASLLDSSWKLVSLFYLLLEETVIPNSAIVYFSCSNLILMN